MGAECDLACPPYTDQLALSTHMQLYALLGKEKARVSFFTPVTKVGAPQFSESGVIFSTLQDFNAVHAVVLALESRGLQSTVVSFFFILLA
jgi:hypothetical protein